MPKTSAFIISDKVLRDILGISENVALTGVMYNPFNNTWKLAVMNIDPDKNNSYKALGQEFPLWEEPEASESRVAGTIHSTYHNKELAKVKESNKKVYDSLKLKELRASTGNMDLTYTDLEEYCLKNGLSPYEGTR